MRSSARFVRRSTTTIALVLATISVIVAACSGSAAQAPARGAGEAAEQPQAAASAAAAAGGGAGNPSTGQGGQPDDIGNPAALVDDTKIVRTGSLEVTVADTNKALNSARDAIRGLGGYIGGGPQAKGDGKIVATVTYRIPVARWEDA